MKHRNVLMFVTLLFFVAAMVFALPGSPSRHSGNNPSNHNGSNDATNSDWNDNTSADDWSKNNEPTPSTVPEPMTLVLFGLGMAGLAALGRKKQD